MNFWKEADNLLFTPFRLRKDFVGAHVLSRETYASDRHFLEKWSSPDLEAFGILTGQLIDTKKLCYFFAIEIIFLRVHIF